MASLYERSDGIECRACGAAFAQPDDKGPFCSTCMSKVQYMMGLPLTEYKLNKFLCRQLELAIARKRQHGTPLRCEALTMQDINGNAGYQCQNAAKVELCGRYLCKKHAYPRSANGRPKITQFIEEYKDPYDWLQEIISDLCNVDNDFKMSVLKGAGVF